MSKSLPHGALLDSMRAEPAALSVRADPGGDWLDGHAITAHGIVAIYAQGRKTGLRQATTMSVVAGGRYCTATWQRTFSERFLLTVAKRFAVAVAREHSSPRQVVQPIRDEPMKTRRPRAPVTTSMRSEKD